MGHFTSQSIKVKGHQGYDTLTTLGILHMMWVEGSYVVIKKGACFILACRLYAWLAPGFIIININE